ncbi:DEDD exonuclease domain-containing protein [Brevibacterium jeotgali]|nr:DEDD exonuclease domain-containing protein [Brevibacterium jeotgali]
MPSFDRSHTHTRGGQLSLADLGTPLHDVDFVIVDLETTGAHSADNAITEIGAVRVRGGEVLGEFQSLVRPVGSVISPFVARLTGITNGMVADAPRIEAVLPSFLEFMRGAVLVAHNAPFDVGFLRAACARLDYTWPAPKVLDTVALARKALPRTEVRNHKLATLAAFFGTDTEPDHRALSDARATVGVLHALFEIYGSHGIVTLEDLSTVRTTGWSRRRRKTHLADGLPHGPGVYTFLDGSRRVLYIGSSGDMRARVRSYFTESETRGRMTEMVTAAQEVSPLLCATVLEARVREVRLIGELEPPYNRRSKRPEKRHWLVETQEEFPRLSAVRSLTRERVDAGRTLGPFRSAASARAAKQLLETVFPLKSCTGSPGSARFAPCAAAQVDRCHGPCAGLLDPAEYAQSLAGLRGLFAGDPGQFLAGARQRISDLASQERFETAAEVRDAVGGALHSTAGHSTRSSLRSIEEVVAAERREDGGWDLAVIRHGRLAAAGSSHRGVSPYPAIDALRLSAEFVAPHDPVTPQTTDEETDLLVSWLSSGTTRLVRSSTAWSQAAHGIEAARLAWTQLIRPGS